MTEAEWLDCTDPPEMVKFLQGKASERKLRLFAVACCRRIWDSITEPCSRQAVKISERYADGSANYEQLEAAFMAADRASSGQLEAVVMVPDWSKPVWLRLRSWHALDAARLSAHPEMRGLADGTAAAAAMAGAGSGENLWKQYASEQVHQCILLREIVGNPFRPVAIDRTWLTPTVVNLSQTIYLFLAPQVRKDASLGTLFEKVLPRDRSQFQLELGAILPDLLPNLEGKPEFTLLVANEGNTRDLCFSNVMARLRYVKDNQLLHALIPRRVLPLVRAGEVDFIPRDAAVELLRTFSTSVSTSPVLLLKKPSRPTARLASTT